jgi:hypothetical protein
MTVDLMSLSERRIEQADIIMRVYTIDGTVTLVARDAGTHEFVPINALGQDPTARPVALSYDGRKFLFSRMSPGPKITPISSMSGCRQ